MRKQEKIAEWNEWKTMQIVIGQCNFLHEIWDPITDFCYLWRFIYFVYNDYFDVSGTISSLENNGRFQA